MLTLYLHNNMDHVHFRRKRSMVWQRIFRSIRKRLYKETESYWAFLKSA